MNSNDECTRFLDEWKKEKIHSNVQFINQLKLVS